MGELREVSYQFPAAKAIGVETPGGHLDHVFALVGDVKEDLVNEAKSVGEIETRLAELHHSIESFWRSLAARNGQDYVDGAFERYEQFARVNGLLAENA